MKCDRNFIKNVCNQDAFHLMEQLPNLFREKEYSIPLGYCGLELRFSITKDTNVPALPIYLDLYETCTDIKKLLFDMLNTQEDTIDYGQWMHGFGVANISSKAATEVYGYFGNDPVFYEGLKVHKKIVAKIDTYYDISDMWIDKIKEIEKTEYDYETKY